MEDEERAWTNTNIGTHLVEGEVRTIKLDQKKKIRFDELDVSNNAEMLICTTVAIMDKFLQNEVKVITKKKLQA